MSRKGSPGMSCCSQISATTGMGSENGEETSLHIGHTRRGWAILSHRRHGLGSVIAAEALRAIFDWKKEIVRTIKLGLVRTYRGTARVPSSAIRYKHTHRRRTCCRRCRRVPHRSRDPWAEDVARCTSERQEAGTSSGEKRASALTVAAMFATMGKTRASAESWKQPTVRWRGRQG
jgi:hypothetical protein